MNGQLEVLCILFVIDDPDLAEMADYMDEQDQRLAAQRGVL